VSGTQKDSECVSQLARDLHVCRILLYKWRDRLHPVNSPALSQVLRQRSREAALRKEIDKLKQLLADKVLEMDFFKTALRKTEARRRSSGVSGEQASTMQSVMPLQGSLSVARMCQLAQVSRAGFYRNLGGQAPNEESMILRSSIQDVALEHRLRYGYRRITMELRHRGMAVNHKRVAQMMQEDNLLVARHTEWLRASGPAYELEIYLNLAKRMKISGTNQLWIADITFVRLKTEFIYLAVVLDAFSRGVVGWAVDRTLRQTLPLSALNQAVANRQPPAGLVHHSDQGVQYTSEEYIQVLRVHEIIPSISRPGRPQDNATCESFLRTLKREEIYANDYRDLEDLARRIEEFIEHYYSALLAIFHYGQIQNLRLPLARIHFLAVR
jgi:putative transposase